MRPSSPDPTGHAGPPAPSRPPGVPDDWPIPPVALPRLVDDAVRDLPDGLALVRGTLHLTYLELDVAVRAILSRLAAAGAGRGARVVVDVADPARRLAVAWAVWRVGATLVPAPDPRGTATTSGTDPVRAAAGTREALAVRVGARAIVTDRLVDGSGEGASGGPRGAGAGAAVGSGGARATSRAASRAAARLAARATGGLAAQLLALGRTRGVPAPPVPLSRRLRSGGAATRSVADVEVAARGAVAPTLPGPPAPEDVALVLDGTDAASGTLTHAQLVAAAFQARLWVPDVTTGCERVVLDVALDDPAMVAVGMLATTLAAGTIVDAAGDPVEAVDRELATMAVVRPPGLEALARPGRRDLTSLRVVLVVGGAVVPEVADRVTTESAGARVAGLTAVAGRLPTHAGPVYGRAEGIGLPLTATRAMLVDDDGRRVGAGTVGRVVVAGPQLPGEVVTDVVAVQDERGALRVVSGDVAPEPGRGDDGPIDGVPR